jgi:hypothetical protein
MIERRIRGRMVYVSRLLQSGLVACSESQEYRS